MEKIVYVTGNYGKYYQVKKQFQQHNLAIEFFHCDLEEPMINDIKYISKRKVEQAYQQLNRPCFVADSGFYIEDYPNHPNYPGAFVKRSGVASNIDQLLMNMKDVENRSCHFVDCLTFYDGMTYYQFFGVSEGTLSYEKRGDFQKQAKSNLWYVFIPKNETKTLAEMTEEEREHRKDDHTSATEEFIHWYKKEYKQKQYRKEKM